MEHEPQWGPLQAPYPSGPHPGTQGGLNGGYGGERWENGRDHEYWSHGDWLGDQRQGEEYQQNSVSQEQGTGMSGCNGDPSVGYLLCHGRSKGVKDSQQTQTQKKPKSKRNQRYRLVMNSQFHRPST